MPTILDWYYQDGSVVVVFSDGHSATLEPYRNNGNVEGFRKFTLQKDDAKIFEYVGRDNRHSFVSAVTHQADGITQQFAASYWTLLRTYFIDEYDKEHEGKMWSAWIICAVESGSYIERLIAGTAPVKASGK